VDASVDTHYPRAIRQLANTPAMSLGQAEAQIGLPPLTETEERAEPAFDALEHIARLEASTVAALTLLRRCIVEDKCPTREALAAEAEFVFGMPGEAAMAEMDEVAQMMGISSLR
jgi:hypothetical protein